MECICEAEVDIDIGDMATFKKITTLTARKVHKCGECGADICPGQKYEKVVGVWGGKFKTYKTCMDCLSVREKFFHHYFYGNIWDDLWDTFLEWRYEVPESCISCLTPKARSRVCDIIEDGWERLEEGWEKED